MSHSHSGVNRVVVCSIVPPYILRSIAEKGTATQRDVAAKTLVIDAQVRMQRQLQPMVPQARELTSAPPHKHRLIYDGKHRIALPGKLVRSEGQAAGKDVAVNEAYDGLGATFDLFCDIYGRNSIDNDGMDMIGTVHYRRKYDNAQWDGRQMIFGDGDGVIFNRFTIAVDVMGHELTHGVTGTTAGLEYQDQPGALNESISDVFGSLVKQRVLGHKAVDADWLIGEGLFTPAINGVALRSMKAPGTAYDDPQLGKDPQPDHMDHYVEMEDDNGGVHINSGIPNKAFYLVATRTGDYAWDIAGHIWYQTLLDQRLPASAQFRDFALLTVENAGKLYDDDVRATVAQAWQEVGVDTKAND